MVVSSRLQWLHARLAEGHLASIALHTRSGKLNVHIQLHPRKVANAVGAGEIGMILGMLQNSVGTHVAVDHGHKNSSGISHASISFKAAPVGAQSGSSAAAPTAEDHPHDEDQNGGAGGHPDSFHDLLPSSPSPQSTSGRDPWSDGNDPWAQASSGQSERKKPRTYDGLAPSPPDGDAAAGEVVDVGTYAWHHGSDGFFSSCGLYEYGASSMVEPHNIDDQLSALMSAIKILEHKVDDATAGLVLLANAELKSIATEGRCNATTRSAFGASASTCRRYITYLRWHRVARAAWENRREWNILTISWGVAFKRSGTCSNASFANLEDKSHEALLGLHMRPYEHGRLHLFQTEDSDVSSSTL